MPYKLREATVIFMFSLPAARDNCRMDASLTRCADDIFRTEIWRVVSAPYFGWDQCILRPGISFRFDFVVAAQLQVIEDQGRIIAKMARYVDVFMQQRKPKIVYSIVSEGHCYDRNGVRSPAHSRAIEIRPRQMLDDHQYYS